MMEVTTRIPSSLGTDGTASHLQSYPLRIPGRTNKTDHFSLQGFVTFEIRADSALTMGTEPKTNAIVSKYLQERREEMEELHDAFAVEKPLNTGKSRGHKDAWEMSQY